MKEDIETTSEATASRAAGLTTFRFDRIVAPTDFSPNSEKAITYAVELACQLGAKLTLLHIIPEPSALDYSMGGISKEELEGWQQEAEKRLAEQLAKAKLAYPKVDAIKRTGLHPRDEIVSAVTDLSADLLVISTHGYRGWKHFLFGSDAEKILRQTPCPTLVVR